MQPFHFLLDKICKILTYNTPFYHSQSYQLSETVRFFGPPCIRFMRIFVGVPWKGASHNSGVIANVFLGFRTLRIRHLRKWGQNYYKVLFRPLSPFHWPQNTWPSMTLNGLEGLFTILRYMFTITNCHWLLICYLFTVVCLLHVWPTHVWPTEKCGKRSSRIFGIRGKSVVLP